MNIKLQLPKVSELKPRITVIGVGGAGGNAVENMIASGLEGVEFVVANTDAQALSLSSAPNVLQLGVALTEGLGAGSRPEIGEAAAEEALNDIRAQISGSHMVFIAAGMGGGTGTGAAAVIARVAKELGILTVAIVTKPFLFEGTRRMRVADAGIAALKPNVDTLIVIPNQNLFRIADEKTTFSDAFVLADRVLHSGICCIVDLIVRDGLINLDFADVRTVMKGMGDAVMGAGEATGERRAERAAEQAIANPLLDDVSLHGAKGLLVSIAGGHNLTLYEVDEAANRVKREVDPDANIIVGATIDETLDDRVRVSIVASGMAGYHGRGAAQPAYGSSLGASHRQPQAPHGQPQAGVEWSVPDRGLRTEEPLDEHQARMPMPPPLPEWPDPDQSADESRREQMDIGEALSEAIVRAGHQGSGHWENAKGVRITQVPPEARREDGHGDHRGSGTHRGGERYSDFEPRLTDGFRRPVPRMPGIEDFPVVGQRDYHAKRGGVDQSGHRSSADSRRHGGRDAGESKPRKLSLFERITGVRRRASDSPVEQHDVPSENVTQERDAQRPAGREALRPKWSEAHANDGRRVDEDTDIPEFFSDRKRR